MMAAKLKIETRKIACPLLAGAWWLSLRCCLLLETGGSGVQCLII